jgi:hypothetical protein
MVQDPTSHHSPAISAPPALLPQSQVAVAALPLPQLWRTCHGGSRTAVQRTQGNHRKGGPGGEAPPGGVWGSHPRKAQRAINVRAYQRTQIAQIDRAPGRIRTCAPASGGRCSIP